MDSWRKVWREGVDPVLSLEGLQALERALKTDDPRLLQGATTTPPPLQSVMDWPVEAACALGLCGWLGDELDTVGEVEEFFGRVCWEVDRKMNERAGSRWFLNAYDEWPRPVMIAKLLPEVQRSLALRMGEEVPDDLVA